jgi:hypothetical protein
MGIEAGADSRTVHGDNRKLNEAPEYRAWVGMIQRCENPNLKNFSRYGGRGIKVCAAWRQSYLLFLKDMGRRPSPQHSLDRIDNDGDYEPSNCQWATASEQMHNTRRAPKYKDRWIYLDRPINP